MALIASVLRQTRGGRPELSPISPELGQSMPYLDRAERQLYIGQDSGCPVEVLGLELELPNRAINEDPDPFIKSIVIHGILHAGQQHQQQVSNAEGERELLIVINQGELSPLPDDPTLWIRGQDITVPGAMIYSADRLN